MLRIYDDYEELSRAAADLFIERAHDTLENASRFCVALSGGETPLRTYQLLAEHPLGDRVDWARTHIFFSDERLVPGDDPRNNAFNIRMVMLDHIPIPSENVHPVPTGMPAMIAADRYEGMLEDFFMGFAARFDLIFLGLGTEGHTASLFPNTPALEEERHWTADVLLPQEPFHRVTFTPPLINQAAAVAFLVSGKRKSWILQSVLEGETDYRSLPAQIIRPIDGDLYWLVDREAAGQLTQVED